MNKYLALCTIAASPEQLCSTCRENEEKPSYTIETDEVWYPAGSTQHENAVKIE